MKKLLFLATVFISGATIAQDTRVFIDANAQKRTLSGSFTAIHITDGIELKLIQGNEESVAVSASEEKYLERFKTEVKNGVLSIYYDNEGMKWTNSKMKLKAWVSCKTLEKLTASAGSEVDVQNSLESDKLEMKFTSGSEFTGKLNVKQLTVDQNSGSIIHVSGKADKLSVDLSSGAMLKGFDFAVDFCDAKTSSGAMVTITIQKELNAKASSGGGIKYKGEGLIRDINISSGGFVKRTS